MGKLKIGRALAADTKKPNAESDFNTLDFIMAYEGGELDEEGIIKGFQHLIDTGLCWTLQGSYGRMARALIETGHCVNKEEV